MNDLKRLERSPMESSNAKSHSESAYEVEYELEPTKRVFCNMCDNFKDFPESQANPFICDHCLQKLSFSRTKPTKCEICQKILNVFDTDKKQSINIYGLFACSKECIEKIPSFLICNCGIQYKGFKTRCPDCIENPLKKRCKNCKTPIILKEEFCEKCKLKLNKEKIKQIEKDSLSLKPKRVIIGNDNCKIRIYTPHAINFHKKEYPASEIAKIRSALTKLKKYFKSQGLGKISQFKSGFRVSFKGGAIRFYTSGCFMVQFEINPIKIINNSYFNPLRQKICFETTKTLFMDIFSNIHKKILEFIKETEDISELSKEILKSMQIEGNPDVHFDHIAITMDVKYNSHAQKNNALRRIELSNYQGCKKRNIHGESIYFNPIQKRKLPKIKFYDKAKEIEERCRQEIFNIRKESRYQKDYFKKYYKITKESDFFEKNILNLPTHQLKRLKKELEQNPIAKDHIDWLDEEKTNTIIQVLDDEKNSLYEAENTIRYELEWTRIKDNQGNPIKEYFGTDRFHEIQIHNKKTIDKFFKNFLKQQRNINNKETHYELDPKTNTQVLLRYRHILVHLPTKKTKLLQTLMELGINKKTTNKEINLLKKLGVIHNLRGRLELTPPYQNEEAILLTGSTNRGLDYLTPTQ